MFNIYTKYLKIFEFDLQNKFYKNNLFFIKEQHPYSFNNLPKIFFFVKKVQKNFKPAEIIKNY